MNRIRWMLVLGAVAAGCGGHARRLDQVFSAADRHGALKHYGLGHMAYEAGDLASALREFEQSIRLDAGLAVAYAGVGDVYRDRGKPEEAVAPYEKAVELMPYEFTYHYRLGRTYQSLDRNLEAADTYEAAVSLDPDNAPVRVNLGAVYFHLAMDDPDEQGRAGLLAKARTHEETAVRLEPTHGAAWSNLGAVYDAQGELHRAIQAYQKSIGLDPNQAPVRVTSFCSMAKSRMSPS